MTIKEKHFNEFIENLINNRVEILQLLLKWEKNDKERDERAKKFLKRIRSFK